MNVEANKKFAPYAKSISKLNFAMAKIQSVPYKVSGRWLFYQLVQEGYAVKKDYDKIISLLSRVRKNFWGGWTPDILTDSVRECVWKGEPLYLRDIQLDAIANQDYYVQLWFEAQAMYQQFEYYTRDYRVSLIPFRGDCSIPIKWEIAKKLETMAQKYQKPIKVLYFGDYDEKGLQIYISALKDIRAWCNVDFDVERVGLTLEQAQRLNLPENPLKPHAYQWEALSDKDASTLILGAVTKYLRKIPDDLVEKEVGIRIKIDEVASKLLAEEGLRLQP